ncbi:Potassium channel domain, partial [Trinorchestia longiramus]
MPVPVWTVEEYQDPNHSHSCGSSSAKDNRLQNTKNPNSRSSYAPSADETSKSSQSCQHNHSVPHTPRKRAIIPRLSLPTENSDDGPSSPHCWPCIRNHSSSRDQVSSTFRVSQPTPPSIHPEKTKKFTYSEPASGRLGNIQHSIISFFMIKEDNARFFLLTFLILLYMILGAGFFQAFEETSEAIEREKTVFNLEQQIMRIKTDLQMKNCTWDSVEALIFSWGNASENGLVDQRPRWDYGGSFQFVYTVISTIGYGAASPRTLQGKGFCIVYGIIGCSACILFFNLFLERIITIMAVFMRARHLKHKERERQQIAVQDEVTAANQPKRRQQKSKKSTSIPDSHRGKSPKTNSDNSGSVTSDAKSLSKSNSSTHNTVHSHESKEEPKNNSTKDDLADWKPSVYKVLLYLSIISLTVGLIAALVFSQMEGWSYVDSFYFCFISFATIGFGDLVATERHNSFYGSLIYVYRFFNFLFLVLGCCCIYSLFNVISIAIKQLLNWLIKLIATACIRGCGCCCQNNDIVPSLTIQDALFQMTSQYRFDNDTIDIYNLETERKLSGEVSLKEFILSNKVSA